MARRPMDRAAEPRRSMSRLSPTAVRPRGIDLRRSVLVSARESAGGRAPCRGARRRHVPALRQAVRSDRGRSSVLLPSMQATRVAQGAPGEGAVGGEAGGDPGAPLPVVRHMVHAQDDRIQGPDDPVLLTVLRDEVSAGEPWRRTAGCQGWQRRSARRAADSHGAGRSIDGSHGRLTPWHSPCCSPAALRRCTIARPQTIAARADLFADVLVPLLYRRRRILSRGDPETVVVPRHHKRAPLMIRFSALYAKPVARNLIAHSRAMDGWANVARLWQPYPPSRGPR